MKNLTVIAIDRAEAEIGRACKKLAKELNVDTKGVMLVNSDFKNSPAYKGDESNGYFTEIVCDFKDRKQLKSILKYLNAKKAIFHCRMEEAVKDYAKVVSLTSNKYVPSASSLLNSNIKYKMRQKIAQRYPEVCPKFAELRGRRELNHYLIKDFKFPLIVKPNGLHSSFFVAKCKNYEDLKESVDNAFNGIKKVYEREYGTGQPGLVIEEFMEGDMYSIDAYVDHRRKIYCLPPIRVITAAELGLDGYYSYRHIVPTDLSEDDIKDANICTEKAILALGLKASTAHVELYKTKDGWKIIEVGPRIGGYRQDLYYEAFGIDHYYNDLLIHYGQKPNIKKQWHKFAAGFNMYAEKEGVINNIKGIDKARSVKSVVYLNVNIPVGGVATFASNGGQFVIDGILANSDKDQLESDVKKVRELIKIEVV